MKIFPVKHSKLLAQPNHIMPRGEMTALINKVIDNLINIKDETGEFLLRLDDGRVIDTKGWAGWEWTHGIGLYGMYQFYSQTGDQNVHKIISDWFSERLAEGMPTKNVNTVCPFLTLAYCYEETKDPKWLTYLDSWAEWVMHKMPRTECGGIQHIVYNNENHQQLWDDTLMMSVLPLAKIGKLLNRPEYIQEAIYQILIHIEYLMDRSTGLWFHGWTFDGNHNFANARWARGNSWLTIVIPEFIELLDLKDNDPIKRILVQVLTVQVEALKKYQDESGLWHTIIDDKSSYLEASATAGFAYGILKSIRKNYISDEYQEMAEKAVKGVINNIDDKGTLQQVSFGTAMGNDLDFYRNIPLTSMPYGQAMAILCLTEYLRVFI
ncbi:beta-galactosidase BglB [Orbus mooreae]|uniref:beta-galactosidase BglB n=1 Tax=Orbus mooreae TaxID=3074107 RepID=UPI00370D4C7E